MLASLVQHDDRARLRCRGGCAQDSVGIAHHARRTRGRSSRSGACRAVASAGCTAGFFMPTGARNQRGVAAGGRGERAVAAVDLRRHASGQQAPEAARPDASASDSRPSDRGRGSRGRARGCCSTSIAFDEERRLARRVASNRSSTAGVSSVGTVVDRQPDLLAVRGEARHHGPEPLHVRAQRRIEQQGVRQAPGPPMPATRRIRPEHDERERRDDRETEDHRADVAPPTLASSRAIESRSGNAITAAMALSASNARNCQADETDPRRMPGKVRGCGAEERHQHEAVEADTVRMAAYDRAKQRHDRQRRDDHGELDQRDRQRHRHRQRRRDVPVAKSVAAR